VKPTWRAYGALALALILFWYAATSEVPWLFLLAWCLVALVVATAAYAMWNRSGLSLHLRVAETSAAAGSPVEDLPSWVLRSGPAPAPVFEGDGFGLEIGIVNARGPRGPAWAVGQVGGTETGAGTGLVPTGRWAEVKRMAAASRGPVGARGWRISSGDPLAFFRDVRAVSDAAVVLVLPRFKSLADRIPSRELEAATAAPRAGSGNELFGIREYRPGDSLRRIHWRSSARHGELVVREYEPPGMRTVSILVDPVPPSVAVADQIARIAASEAWDCIREGGRVALGALTTRDIWEVLESLASYPHGDAVESREHGNDVVVTADPDLLEPAARRNWLVGEAPVREDVDFQRVGTAWPL
jgi:uncharacterized protein (DUF58 family)